MYFMALDRIDFTIRNRTAPVQCVTYIFFLIAFVLLTYVSGYGQHPDKQVNSFNSKLSSNHVDRMVQDNRGFLWISTDDGLNKYDGYNFTVYKNIPGDSTSIPDNDIRALKVDPSGNIWMGFSNGSLAYYQHQTHSFTTLNGPELGLKDNIISTLFFDRSGQLWVGVVNYGLYYFDKSSHRFVKAGDLPFRHRAYLANPVVYETYNSVYDIYEDPSGLFWMATHDGLYTYNPKTNLFKAIREREIVPFTERNDLFWSLLATKDGFWLSSWGGGISFYNKITNEWKNYKPGTGDVGTHNIILDMAWKAKDQLWVASLDHGFGYFDITKEKFTFSDVLRTRRILKDSRGGIWISTEGDGMIHFDPDATFSFHPVSVQRSDNNDFYFTYSFYHDVNNQLLYYGVSYGDGLHVYDEQTNKEKVLPFDYLERGLHVASIYKDNLDTLWILTNDFIYTYDPVLQRLNKFIQPFDESAANKKVFSPHFTCIKRASNGDLWVGTYDHGVYRYSFATKKYTTYSSTDGIGLESNLSRAIEEDRFGRIWIISKHGVYLFNPKSNHFTREKNLSNNNSLKGNLNLMDFTTSPDGNFWISSNNGVYQYIQNSDSIKLVRWSAAEGIPSGKITNIKADRKGGIWFSMYSGIWHLDPYTKKVLQVTGPPEQSSNPSIHIDDQNTIFIGAYRGYSTYRLKVQFTNSVAPPLVITSFKLNNKEILDDSLVRRGIEVDYFENSIVIEFAALDFRNASKNKYSFKLDGIDTEWSPPNSEQRSANYLHLPPGDYTFKVKAASMEDVWTLPLTIAIHIAPPFWLTWYFKVGMMVIVVLLLYLFLRWRANVNQKKLEITERLLETEMSSLRAQMNPHFIFNSLNSINKFILMADREMASFYLTKFAKLIRSILENSNKSRISLDQELSALKHYIDMELLRFDHKFAYSIEIDPEIDPMVLSFPPLIIQPYVENSIWHGFTKRGVFGKLTIVIKKEFPNMLVITVEDNGVGRNAKKSTLEAANKKSHGLKITADRLQALRKDGKESSVEIVDLLDENSKPAGTRVIIRLAIFES